MQISMFFLEFIDKKLMYLRPLETCKATKPFFSQIMYEKLNEEFNFRSNNMTFLRQVKSWVKLKI